MQKVGKLKNPEVETARQRKGKSGRNAHRDVGLAQAAPNGGDDSVEREDLAGETPAPHDAAALRGRVQDAGELLRALAAAFEGLDAAQIRRHTQLAVMGAMVEQLVSCPRKLSGTVLNAMFKLLGDPQPGAGRAPRREGPIEWPPELPEIVRKLYGVNVFDTPRTLPAGEPEKAAAGHPEESPAEC